MLSKFKPKKKEEPEPIQMSEMTEMTDMSEMTETKELLLQRASTILLALEKMIEDKKKYLAMLDNNTEYKQKLGEDYDKNQKAWVVYSYPENIKIDERGRIYKKIWDLDIDKIDSVKQFKKEYLYETLNPNPKFSSYNFNDRLLLEIEQFKNNMLAEGKRKRKRKRKKRKTKRKKSKRKKTKRKYKRKAGTRKNTLDLLTRREITGKRRREDIPPEIEDQFKTELNELKNKRMTTLRQQMKDTREKADIARRNGNEDKRKELLEELEKITKKFQDEI